MFVIVHTKFLADTRTITIYGDDIANAFNTLKEAQEHIKQFRDDYDSSWQIYPLNRLP